MIIYTYIYYTPIRKCPFDVFVHKRGQIVSIESSPSVGCALGVSPAFLGVTFGKVWTDCLRYGKSSFGDSSFCNPTSFVLVYRSCSDILRRVAFDVSVCCFPSTLNLREMDSVWCPLLATCGVVMCFHHIQDARPIGPVLLFG